MSTVNETDEQVEKSTSIEPVTKASLGRQLKFDDQGYLIPPTAEEMAEDHQALLIALAEMAAIPDDPPGSDKEFWRAIDAGRPERRLFREFYEP